MILRTNVKLLKKRESCEKRATPLLRLTCKMLFQDQQTGERLLVVGQFFWLKDVRRQQVVRFYSGRFGRCVDPGISRRRSAFCL